MFSCERCGSRYSAMHGVTLENCPRCQIRDRVSAPLAFKAFEASDFPAGTGLKPRSLPLAATVASGGNARREADLRSS
jgi:predicted  nucleic acid-binding Zn-ribbon protein